MAARLQQWLDVAAMASRQRWAFGTLAVGSVFVALLATLVGSDDGFGWFSAMIVIVATVAAIQPGSHAAAVVVALVVVQWLSAADDVTTPRSLVVAPCLLVFHGLIALMAVTPHSATVAVEVVRQWARRSIVVAVATTAVWVLVHVFERRESAANPHLTLLALLAAGAGVAALLLRSVDDADL